MQRYCTQTAKCCQCLIPKLRRCSYECNINYFPEILYGNRVQNHLRHICRQSGLQRTYTFRASNEGFSWPLQCQSEWQVTGISGAIACVPFTVVLALMDLTPVSAAAQKTVTKAINMWVKKKYRSGGPFQVHSWAWNQWIPSWLLYKETGPKIKWKSDSIPWDTLHTDKNTSR